MVGIRQDHWWTCHLCFDQMSHSTDEAQVAHDRDAHIKKEHPDWQPSDAELNISSWALTA